MQSYLAKLFSILNGRVNQLKLLPRLKPREIALIVYQFQILARITATKIKTLQSQPLTKIRRMVLWNLSSQSKVFQKPSLAPQKIGTNPKVNMETRISIKRILIEVTIEKVQVQMQVYFPVLRINLRTKTLTTMIVLISPTLCQELPIMMPTAPRRP
uniref:DNA from chromosome XV (contains gpd3, arg1, gpm3, sp2, gal11 genes) n=1 Tax=Saccharomyces cerevisiae TaxID=4932 RepID=E9PA95_YEASX|nr:unnamed protein product [Saccharomyces cerevisiae]